ATTAGVGAARFAPLLREDFHAGAGDADGVFPLGGEGAVGGDDGPAVVEGAEVAAASVDHGLDGEDHVFAQDGATAAFAEVENCGGFVQSDPAAVAALSAHDGKAVFFGVLLAGPADVADGVAGFDLLDAEFHAFAGDIDQFACGRAHLPDAVHAR